MQKRLRVERCEKLFEGISIADMTERKNFEKVFNETALQRRPISVLFDRAKLQIGVGRKDKEFCDLLDLTNDGVVRISIASRLLGRRPSTIYFHRQSSTVKPEGHRVLRRSEAGDARFFEGLEVVDGVLREVTQPLFLGLVVVVVDAQPLGQLGEDRAVVAACLLYTSDAADE